MKIKFWLEGRGGMCSDVKIVNLDDSYTKEDIKQELDDWVYGLRCNSDYVTYGYEEVKSSKMKM